ncbi:hypothetical protein [Citrobacter sp. Igbk 17]|uniref:hypothetical protein n=1 Tax=Citrobacter sp. Igbk 17 TaxID=2963957 RepID=UPI00230307FA|nr:hypothetical protein [Citrobacter sp. Igbk 17]MDA8500174.1 hypothetical protein [Citrobacter sp. Igbk 17]
MNIYTKTTAHGFNDLTDFNDGTLNNWMPRLPEYNDKGQLNWAVAKEMDEYHSFDNNVLYIPTRDNDNAGTVVSKKYELDESRVYEFSVTVFRLTSITSPQLSLRVGFSGKDCADDVILCQGEPVATQETTMVCYYQPGKHGNYLKIHNSVATGIGNDYAIIAIGVKDVGGGC